MMVGVTRIGLAQPNGHSSGEWQLESGIASGSGYGSRPEAPGTASTMNELRGRHDDDGAGELQMCAPGELQIAPPERPVAASMRTGWGAADLRPLSGR